MFQKAMPSSSRLCTHTHTPTQASTKTCLKMAGLSIRVARARSNAPVYLVAFSLMCVLAATVCGSAHNPGLGGTPQLRTPYHDHKPAGAEPDPDENGSIKAKVSRVLPHHVTTVYT